jgi:multiple sugar transport system permease protein
MKLTKQTLFFIGVMFYLIYTLFPIYWLGISSFKKDKEIFSMRPTLFPQQPTIKNYVKIVEGEGIGVNFLASLGNTAVIAISVTVVDVLIGGIAAYGISRSRSRLIYSLPLVFLLFSLTPPQTYALPIFITLREVGLLDTRLGLALVYLAFSLPLPIWFLSQYFKSIPREFEDSAKVDGCGRFQIIFRIVFPLAAPALSTSAIFAFMHTWNEFFFASILTSRQAITMPVAIMNFQDARAMAWDLSTAASMLAVVPLVLILTVLQRYVIHGLTAGGIKG